MPVRDQLSGVLRGEVGADLSPKSRARLESLAHDAQSENLIKTVRDECAARLRQGGATPGVDYLLAAVCALGGEVERAHQTLLALGERLVSASEWEPLATVAERALALEETHAAARLLVRAHEGLARDPARIEALERAWGIMPDDLEIGLLLAERLGAVGQGDHRRELLTELMPRFAADGRYAGLEEAALEFVEHDAHDGLVRLLNTLPVLAQKDALGEAKLLIDASLGALETAGRAGECAAALRTVALRALERQGPAAAEPFRDPVVRALRQNEADSLPDVERVIAESGLTDPEQPISSALERYDQIAALAPGRAVYHDSFGPGRVLSNDAEVVMLDFASSRGHRMPYAAARRTLSPLAEDDARLLRFTDPAGLKRMRADDPGELLVRSLRAIGGAADAQKLKVFMVGTQLVAPAEWTTFWRKARAAAEKDPRIDHARAFEQHYRLAPEGPVLAKDRAPLPNLGPRKTIASNLTTLRKFLSQHPDAEPALAQRFGKFVARAVLDETADRADRARAGMYFARWFPDRREEWTNVLKILWEQGLAITDLPAEDEQLAVLEGSHSAGVESDAILSALDSRFSAVREEALLYHAQLDDAGRADLRRTLIQHAGRYPSAALRLIEEALTSPAGADGWNVLVAALMLIEDRPKPSVAEKVLRAIGEGGAFDSWLAGSVPGDEIALKVRVLLRQWRSSDRFLFPAIEAVQRLGLPGEAALVREQRQKRSEKLFSNVGQPSENVELSVMTRATWVILQRELEEMGRELRTTIPATIQRARELGDLRENAEYHSAKLKQANMSKRVATLQFKLARARFVDDAEFRDGVVGLGARVTLEGPGGPRVMWILGEGEQHHGPEVVSFQSVVGRVLMNRALGDEVELAEGESRVRWRIGAIERRLPAVQDSEAGSG
ncbi:MAG: GreA/GreB family elongation factor [Candidatus Eisenbacteria bacterium]|nr:GreA/GreB family elongation factor [Candidatus Eisenbacteria bacterium]